MARSTITSKFQTTVPAMIRESLHLAPQDVLIWELDEGFIRVSPARRAFLDRRGALAVGPGSSVEDVARARGSRGLEGA